MPEPDTKNVLNETLDADQEEGFQATKIPPREPLAGRKE
jgi:hypothetical protein